MEIAELRNILMDFPKYPGTRKVAPALVCNDGFPGNFNLSFTEAEMLKEYGQYIDYDHDLIYSKIQPVIRYNDFVENIAKPSESTYRYLGVFDLADVGGSVSLVDGSKREEISQFAIDSMYLLLFDKLGLDKKNLRVSYFGGGNVKEITKGKYNLDCEIPADSSIEYWKQQGLSEKQFIADYSRDTLLSLNIYGLPTPWGFRQEINYLHDGKLLDIGTFERVDYCPVFNDQNELCEIKPWQHAWSIAAVGLERLLLVINQEKRVHDLPHIRPLRERVLGIIKSDEAISIAVAEAIRVIHRVIADAGSYSALSSKRKEKFRTYCKIVIDNSKQLEKEQLIELFSLNAKLQSYYPELIQAVDQAAQEIVEAKERFKVDKSLKHRGVAQK